MRLVCEFLEIDPDLPFRDPGAQNSSKDYRGRFLAKILVERGVGLPCTDGEVLADAERERCITPSPAQVEELRALLGPDLGRFAREWGVDPWERRPSVAPATAAA